MMYHPRTAIGRCRSAFGMLRGPVLLITLLCTLAVAAQVDNVMVFGTVKDMTTAKKLDGVTVTVFKNGAKLVDVMSNASG